MVGVEIMYGLIQITHMYTKQFILENKKIFKSIIILSLSLFLLLQTQTPLHSIDKNNIVKVHVSSYDMMVSSQYKVLEENAADFYNQMKSGLYLKFFQIPGLGGAFKYRIELFYEEDNETKSIVIFYNNHYIIPSATIDGKNYLFFNNPAHFIESYLKE